MNRIFLFLAVFMLLGANVSLAQEWDPKLAAYGATTWDHYLATVTKDGATLSKSPGLREKALREYREYHEKMLFSANRLRELHQYSMEIGGPDPFDLVKRKIAENYPRRNDFLISRDIEKVRDTYAARVRDYENELKKKKK